MSFIITFLKTLWPLVEGISNKVIVTISTEQTKKYSKIIFNNVEKILNTRNSYKNRLKAELKNMPFIYRDIDTDILNDYVAIEAMSLNIENLKEENRKNIGALANKNKAVFFGNAGIGKTTFFRHSILSILNNKSESYLKDTLNLLPVFIQLKAVNNIQKSPIIHYILNEISYFKGSNGIERLSKITDKHNIFLILDGYDEIGFVASTNFMKYELDMLLSPISNNSLYNKTYLNAEYYNIYIGLSRCKVWLSTRKEFFDLNPLQLISSNNENGNFKKLDSRDTNFIALSLVGLGENRFKLIENIFKKYKPKSKIFEENLNEEKFYNDLVSINDKELMSLTQSPLFLTIMCYLYADRIEKGNSTNKKWITNSYDLIDSCIKTLLIDLDKFKVRDIKGVKREAFEERRSAFFEEKIDFLRYFSLQTYIRGINVISESDLNQHALYFFNNVSKSSNNSVIISGLNESNLSTNPSIVKQILFSGLFILVPGDSKIYDFPHRRFKETLALESIVDDKSIPFSIFDNSISEFVLILFEYKKSRRIEIIQLIFNQLELEVDNLSSIYLNKLLYNCLSRSVDYNPSAIFEEKINYWISQNTQIHLSKTVLERCHFSPSFFISLTSRVQNLPNYNYSAKLVLSLLYYSNEAELQALLKSINIEKQSEINKCLINAYELVLSSPSNESLLELFIAYFDSKNYSNALSILLIDYLSKNDKSKVIDYLLENLDFKYKFYLIYALSKLITDKYKKITHDIDLVQEISFSNYIEKERLDTTSLNKRYTFSNLVSYIETLQKKTDRLKTEIIDSSSSDTELVEKTTEFDNNLKQLEDELRKHSRLKRELEQLMHYHYDENILNVGVAFHTILEVAKSGIIDIR